MINRKTGGDHWPHLVYANTPNDGMIVGYESLSDLDDSGLVGDQFVVGIYEPKETKRLVTKRELLSSPLTKDGLPLIELPT